MSLHPIFADLISPFTAASPGLEPPAPRETPIPWAYAGGDNECPHGYAEGIPCPQCDCRRDGGEV